MRIPKIVTNLLHTAAPTLLRALSLPPPLNNIAAQVASGALTKLVGKPEGGALSPEEMVQAIDAHAGDPEIFARLREAEMELQRYEAKAGVRFAELENADRKRASQMIQKSGLGPEAFKHGMRLVWFAIACVLFIVAVALVVSFLPNFTPNGLTTATFGIVGTAIGFISGIASSIVTFYYGSSQGSKDKTEAMQESIRSFGEQLTEERKRNAPPPTPHPGPADAAPPPGHVGGTGLEAIPPIDEDPAAAAQSDEQIVREAAQPASHSLVREILPALAKPHKKFGDGVFWALTSGGISVENGTPERTPGNPESARRIWRDFGEHAADAARTYGVPVELIIATIATESSGRPHVRRKESRGRESVGLMQTLIATAREALGRPSLSGDDLLDPKTSIMAGTAYIAQQRKVTHFDPPLVAAAYNAGSVYHNSGQSNRWKMRCYPIGTGTHIDKFVAWFGDAMVVAAEEDWGENGTVPSFAAALAGGQPRHTGGASGAATAPAPALAGARSLSAVAALSALREALDVDKIETDPGLAIEIQTRLAEFGYLDPPPDGKFRSISRWALGAFCGAHGLTIGQALTPDIAAALADPARGLPPQPSCPEHPWIDRVTAYLPAHGYWVSRVPECRNIVYLEGANPDGTLNDDAPNKFNDLRIVFWVDGDSGETRARMWEATTEPGRFWTEQPMNRRGAARIKFGQYRAWQFGTHRKGTRSEHEALVQVRDVSVHRDLNKDYKRTGDRVYTGLFGINQHSGYNLSREDLGRSSAGCLVGRTTDGHAEFLAELKNDPRYKTSNTYTFLTTILPADDVLG